MEPKFMTPLSFRCDGTLEVCGPTNFDPDDVLLEITQLTIVQGSARMSPTLPFITVAPNQNWETEISGAKPTLNEGPALGAAAGYKVKKSGGRVPVAWPGSLMLVDGCAILQEIAPGLVAIWNDYPRRSEQNEGADNTR